MTDPRTSDPGTGTDEQSAPNEAPDLAVDPIADLDDIRGGGACTTGSVEDKR